ncbi:hypothetical protein GUJ93_ZPchr0009g1648 [Zizania palustris]|uniref:Uncharacterized protein n=1 Tax=Zizania palustris TaxID=103762 RepID=A0A8J5RL95_ZIZPA|nr:hypothetical protein GUJ93_ZPchr0009g1648 [Zizania palustris]
MAGRGRGGRRHGAAADGGWPGRWRGAPEAGGGAGARQAAAWAGGWWPERREATGGRRAGRWRGLGAGGGGRRCAVGAYRELGLPVRAPRLGKNP